MIPNLRLISKLLYVIVMVIVIIIAVQIFLNPFGVYQNVNTALLIVAVSLSFVRLWLRRKISKTEKVDHPLT
jgi:hypothetical protein